MSRTTCQRRKLDGRYGKTDMSTTIKEVQVGDIGAQAASHLDGDRMALNVGPFSSNHTRCTSFDDGIGW